MSASFGDYDADGRLDLYVTNTVQFDYKDPDPMECHYRGITVQCGPLGMAGDSDILYRNNGDGTFRDVSEKAGVSDVPPSYGLGGHLERLRQRRRPRPLRGQRPNGQLSLSQPGRRHLRGNRALRGRGFQR